MTAAPAFATSGGLRRLLNRLHESGDDAWRDDTDAADLLLFTMAKYGPLARRHHLTPADVAPVALVCLRTRAVREARDPWAAVTRAIQRALIAEERGNGLLCSPAHARRASPVMHHDAIRVGDRPLACAARPSDTDVAGAARDRVDHAVATVVEVFVACGWDRDIASFGIETIVCRCTDARSAHTAYECLRRDPTTRNRLGITQRAWLAMLRAVLGDPLPHRAPVRTGGALRGACLGLAAQDLLNRDGLAGSLIATAPAPRAGADPPARTEHRRHA